MDYMESTFSFASRLRHECKDIWIGGCICVCAYVRRYSSKCANAPARSFMEKPELCGHGLSARNSLDERHKTRTNAGQPFVPRERKPMLACSPRVDIRACGQCLRSLLCGCLLMRLCVCGLVHGFDASSFFMLFLRDRSQRQGDNILLLCLGAHRHAV